MWKELKDERAAAAATADSWHCGTLAGPHYAMTWHMNVFTLCRPLLHRPSIVSLTNSYIQRDVGDVAAHQSAGYNHVYATLPFCWCPCISKHRNGGGICVFSVLHQRYTTYVRTTRIYSIYIMCTTGNLMTIISHVPLNGTISNKSGFICFFFFFCSMFIPSSFSGVLSVSVVVFVSFVLMLDFCFIFTAEQIYWGSCEIYASIRMEFAANFHGFMSFCP